MHHHPTSWRSILILFSHLSLGIERGLFPWDFPTKTMYVPLLSLPYMPHAPPLPNSFWLIWSPAKYLASADHKPPRLSSPLPYYFVPLRPRYLPQHPNLTDPRPTCFSLNVRDQVAHPHKTTHKIILLYTSIFHSWVADWKIKYSAPNNSKHSQSSICP